MTARVRFGIASYTLNSSRVATGNDGVNHEISGLVAAAHRRSWGVVLIDPREVAIGATGGDPPFAVAVACGDISHLDALVVRGTGGLTEAVHALCAAVTANGTVLLDPVRRFETSASKVPSTLDRHGRGVGSPSWVVLSEASLAAARMLLQGESRPLLVKPAAGRQGQGVVRLASVAELAAALQSAGGPVIVQVVEDVDAEYRVMLLHGRVLGVARKSVVAGSLTANAATYGRWVKADPDEAEVAARFTAGVVVGEGLFGADIGRRPDGSLFVIEENRAPQWQTFDAVTGLDTAEEVVAALEDQLGTIPSHET